MSDGGFCHYCRKAKCECISEAARPQFASLGTPVPMLRAPAQSPAVHVTSDLAAENERLREQLSQVMADRDSIESSPAFVPKRRENEMSGNWNVEKLEAEWIAQHAELDYTNWLQSELLALLNAPAPDVTRLVEAAIEICDCSDSGWI